MNLHDLLERGNRSIEATPGVVPGTRAVDGEVILGVVFPAGTNGAITVRGASELAEFAGSEDIGLGVMLDPGGTDCEVVTTFAARSGQVQRKTFARAGLYTRLLLPNALDLPDPFEPADLIVSCAARSTRLFLGAGSRPSRDALYRLAKGFGVEIGPGPRPQILNGPEVRVLYVEEMPAQQWVDLYGRSSSSDAWTLPGYTIGKAHELPVDDHSLDFIFSSHVLEHLYNPLGHFDHWRRKLKPGGLVLGVVPGADGTKDFIRPPTSLAELMAEHRAGGFAVPLQAYERWVRELNPADRHPDKAARQLHEGRVSIHVHVYDYVTINNLLRRCVEAHGYAAYRLHYRRNAKDFIFALKAGAEA